MATAPYGIRLLVGAAVIAIEETRRLPQTIIMYPMTVASTVAQIVMKMQQDLAGLAIKGDAALESIFPPKDEKPDWATFDEDLPAEDQPSANGERQTEGRFALYSVTGPTTMLIPFAGSWNFSAASRHSARFASVLAGSRSPFSVRKAPFVHKPPQSAQPGAGPAGPQMASLRHLASRASGT